MAKGSEFTIKVENVVAFTTLNINISLNKLVGSVEDTEYKPEQFPGLVYRPKNPKSAALIFSSGKIVCTGTKSIDMAKQAMKKVVERIKKSGVSVPAKYPIHVENIVASSRIKAEIHLEDIAFSLDNAEYEPEQFPGLVYRIKDPRVAFLLFSSGKIICTGAQNEEDIHTALAKFKEKLEGIGVKVKPLAE
ncbi:MAG: TATA-box-binding protein [Candidatus Aenigmarchaeota archaeon]